MATAKDAKKPQEEAEFRTSSGTPVKEIYTPDDLNGFDYMKKLGYPGEVPFTRGINPPSYRTNWHPTQYFGFGTAKSTNELLKYVLAHGAEVLLVAFHLPSQCGYDSDHPMSRGEVGRVGVAIDSLQDLEVVFEGIPLEGKRIALGATSSIGPIIMAWCLALCEKQGVSPQKVRFITQNDPLKEFISRGAYVFPPEKAVKFAVDVIEYCHRQGLVDASPIMFCGYHIREGGANVYQEIAFAMSNAVAYLDDVERRGIKVKDLVISPTAFLAAGTDIFEEVAKWRAFRRMWARTMKERYNCENPQMLALYTTTQPMGSRLTAQQPLNNVIRCTIASLAAILGGVDSLHVAGYDEALGLPSPEALRIALMTGHILAHESGVKNTADPLGGSYYLESLTDEIESGATELFEKVMDMGGALKAIENGFYRAEITKSAYQEMRDLESGRKIVVGVNKYEAEDEKPARAQRVSFAEERRQIQSLRKLRSERDNKQLQAALKRVKEAAIADENLVGPILEAVRLYGTVGEICEVLTELWGRYTSPGM